MAAGRLRRVPVDTRRAEGFLEQAAEALAALDSIPSNHVRFDAAYNAAHDIGEAMLAAYGMRTGAGAGAHVAVGDFLETLFDSPPAREAALAYNTLRSIRNGLRYQAKPPSRAETATATSVARTLLAGARERWAER